MMPSTIQVAKQVLAATKAVSFRNTSDLKVHFEAEYGWRVLGTGQCGVTIVHPYDKNMVVKLITKVQDGSLDFAAWIVRQQMQGKTSVHLPEILAIQITGSHAAVVMERLDPSGCNARWGEPAADATVMQWQKGLSNDPLLSEYFCDFGRPDDMHGGNWMRRGDIPVLIDPMFARPRSNLRWERYWRDGRIQVTEHIEQVDHFQPNWPQPVRKEFYKELADGRRLYKAPMPRVQVRPIKMDLDPIHDMVREMGAEIAKDFDKRFLMDFNQIEKRVLAQQEQMHKHGGWRIPRFGGHVFVDHGMPHITDKRAFNERTALVKDGSPASIRAEKEDRMLRIRSQHDHQSFCQGVQRSLLPGQRPRRVPPAWATFVERVAGAEERVGSLTERATGPPKGLYDRAPDNGARLAA